MSEPSKVPPDFDPMDWISDFVGLVAGHFQMALSEHGGYQHFPHSNACRPYLQSQSTQSSIFGHPDSNWGNQSSAGWDGWAVHFPRPGNRGSVSRHFAVGQGWEGGRWCCWMGLFSCTPIYGNYKRLYIMIIDDNWTMGFLGCFWATPIGCS